MSKKAKTIKVEVVKDASQGSALSVAGSTATVAVLPASPEQMASEIKADMAAFDRKSKEAVFIALRIGLRLVWIRDNSPYGSLKQFTKAHFAGKSERTLFNYISLADTFLREAKLADRKTHKLTGKALATTAPIIEQQLELFTDPEAKLEGAVKKMVSWVGKSSLSDLYKRLEQNKAVLHKSPPPGGGASTTDDSSEDLSVETLIEQAQSDFATVQSIFGGGVWEHLSEEELTDYLNLLDEWTQLIKAVQNARLAADRKGGKA